MLFLCISSITYAQYDNYDTVDDWTLEDVEEEVPKPQHKEYKNFFYLQYSPSRYHTDDTKLKFNEFSVGYARSIQIMEDMPYFLEVGANIKYSHAKEEVSITTCLLSGYLLMLFTSSTFPRRRILP